MKLASNDAEVGNSAYVATDDDTVDGTVDAPLTYAVGGADNGAFDLSATGGLSFKAAQSPNYEGQKEYSITLMVEDDEFALGTYDVKVTVINAEDEGSVTIDAREPQVGKTILATLDDKDGTVRGQFWTWERADNCLAEWHGSMLDLRRRLGSHLWRDIAWLHAEC